jgi:ABC-type polysaccharide/polyol phosphate export permease
LLAKDIPSGRLSLAVADFAGAVALWPLWVRLGWHDILFRYRRSLLGPFWLTANTAITVIALGLVYSEVLRMPISELMPYVCIGLLIWNFISAILHGARGELHQAGPAALSALCVSFRVEQDHHLRS